MNWNALPHRLSLFIASLALFSLAGCASVGSSGAKKLLDEAGFRTVAPATPKQQELYAASPAYQVERATYNRKTFYVYKDEKDGIAYVGDQHNFEKYEELAKQQHIKDQQAAVEMNHHLATGWYGAYRPYVGGVPHYGLYR